MALRGMGFSLMTPVKPFLIFLTSRADQLFFSFSFPRQA
jgi:hypothetical protein